MRILVDVSAVPARPAGAGNYTLALVAALAAGDDALLLVARTSDGDRWRALAPGATVHPVVPDRRPARLLWEQAVAPRLATRLAPDVWHGPHYTMPRRSPVPTVVTVHDLTFFDRPDWHERTKVPYFRHAMRIAAARAGALVAVSEHTARRLRAVLSPAAPVVVAPHGVDRARFRPATGDRDADADADRIARYGVVRPYVAFAGTLEPRKDVPTLVAAFARLARRHPDLGLVLAGGDGWGTAAVRDAVATSGVATRILRPGFVAADDLPALYRQAAVVAYPSLEEGFGLPALEALACGAPLVSTLSSAVEEVVGDAALLVPPGAPDALAAALEEALDATTAARLRDAGPRRAAAFTWSASAARHREAYALACGTAAAPPGAAPETEGSR